MSIDVIFVGVGILFLVIVIATALGRFKMCPPDKVLVVFGKTGKGQSSQCINGGAKFIIPIFQSYGFMSLRPLNIKIELEDALSSQKIRVSVPSNFTIAISKKPELMMAAANRLLGKSDDDISQLAQEIITGQMRIVIATMTIEEINSDREKLIGGISTGVERELEKLGLELINCNITDIQDKSGYIEALGKEAAAKAVNDAQIRVAQENQRGTIGQAEAVRDQKIKVAEAEAAQTVGQNKAAMNIADSNAELAKRRAEATKVATSAELVAAAEAAKTGFDAQKTAEDARALKEEAALKATEVSRANVDKAKAIVAAEAIASVAIKEAEGRAGPPPSRPPQRRRARQLRSASRARPPVKRRCFLVRPTASGSWSRLRAVKTQSVSSWRSSLPISHVSRRTQLAGSKSTRSSSPTEGPGPARALEGSWATFSRAPYRFVKLWAVSGSNFPAS
jgi:flotillin